MISPRVCGTATMPPRHQAHYLVNSSELHSEHASAPHTKLATKRHHKEKRHRAWEYIDACRFGFDKIATVD